MMTMIVLVALAAIVMAVSTIGFAMTGTRPEALEQVVLIPVVVTPPAPGVTNRW